MTERPHTYAQTALVRVVSIAALAQGLVDRVQSCDIGQLARLNHGLPQKDAPLAVRVVDRRFYFISRLLDPALLLCVLFVALVHNLRGRAVVLARLVTEQRLSQAHDCWVRDLLGGHSVLVVSGRCPAQNRRILQVFGRRLLQKG